MRFPADHAGPPGRFGFYFCHFQSWYHAATSDWIADAFGGRAPSIMDSSYALRYCSATLLPLAAGKTLNARYNQ